MVCVGGGSCGCGVGVLRSGGVTRPRLIQRPARGASSGAVVNWWLVSLLVGAGACWAAAVWAFWPVVFG